MLIFLPLVEQKASRRISQLKSPDYESIRPFDSFSMMAVTANNGQGDI
jgi:hypothetical protein